MLVLLIITAWMVLQGLVSVLEPQMAELVEVIGVFVIFIFGITLLLSSIKIKLKIPYNKITTRGSKGIFTLFKKLILFIYKISMKLYKFIFDKLFRYFQSKGVNRILAKTISAVIAIIVVI